MAGVSTATRGGVRCNTNQWSMRLWIWSMVKGIWGNRRSSRGASYLGVIMETRSENLPSVIPFQFESNQVRVIQEKGEPLFVAADIATALGYKDTVNAIKQHCRGVVKHHPIHDALGRVQKARVIHEPDVYRLIVGSQLPSAEKFEAWIFEEVLPSIRKTGCFLPEGARPALPPALEEQARADGIRRGLGLQVMREQMGFGMDELMDFCWYTRVGLNRKQISTLMGVAQNKLKDVAAMMADLGIKMPDSLPGNSLAKMKMRHLYGVMGIGSVEDDFLPLLQEAAHA